jgi:hypothetical protein
MLSVNKYPQTHVDQCRARIAAQLKAYDGLLANGAAKSKSRAAFDAEFFNNLVVVLDASFMHRSRALELKDGNPANEVRMLSASILQNDGVLAADKTIKYAQEKSVTAIGIGQTILLDETRFAALSKAYFEEIEAKFV